MKNPLPRPTFSPLQPWLNRQASLPNFFNPDISQLAPQLEQGWLGIEIVRPIYEVLEIEDENLANSWTKTNEYVQNAWKIINETDGNWLDNEEVMMIKEKLGEPPAVCLPIYIMSAVSPDRESVVYIGKTSSKTSRFRGGHTAITKLHAPEYVGLPKYIYQDCVCLYSHNNYLPLEWVHPMQLALDLLDSVESQLIYHFQPALNEQKKSKYLAKYPISLQIQNFTSNMFLNDKFVFPP